MKCCSNITECHLITIECLLSASEWPSGARKCHCSAEEPSLWCQELSIKYNNTCQKLASLNAIKCCSGGIESHIAIECHLSATEYLFNTVECVSTALKCCLNFLKCLSSVIKNATK